MNYVIIMIRHGGLVLRLNRIEDFERFQRIIIDFFLQRVFDKRKKPKSFSVFIFLQKKDKPLLNDLIIMTLSSH